MLSDSISDRTIVLLLQNKNRIFHHHKAFQFKRFSSDAGHIPTRLMFRLICNLPKLSIRIFLIRLLPIFD